MTTAPRSNVRRFSVPRLLVGVGAFGVAVAAMEAVVVYRPAIGQQLFSFLMILGTVWLAYLALKTRDEITRPSGSSVDRFMLHYAGPLACLLLPFAGWFAMANIEQIQGTNHFRTTWSQMVFEILMASGFVLSLGAVTSRPGMHASPQFFWRVVAIPLTIIFAMYALLTPLSCSARTFGMMD